MDSNFWRVHETLRCQFNKSWTSRLPPGAAQAHPLPPEGGPILCMPLGSLRLEEVILFGMFTEIILFS